MIKSSFHFLNRFFCMFAFVSSCHPGSRFSFEYSLSVLINFQFDNDNLKRVDRSVTMNLNKQWPKRLSSLSAEWWSMAYQFFNYSHYLDAVSACEHFRKIWQRPDVQRPPSNLSEGSRCALADVSSTSKNDEWKDTLVFADRILKEYSSEWKRFYTLF